MGEEILDSVVEKLSELTKNLKFEHLLDSVAIVCTSYNDATDSTTIFMANAGNTFATASALEVKSKELKDGWERED